MLTPAQLCDRLLELGIDRDSRTLTDWRQKGLLPPLLGVSSGRGRGVKRYWTDDVLDQAIAVDWLITDSKSADESLLALWLSGFPVDPIAAKHAWIQMLERAQERGEKAAARYSGGFVGVGRRWWKKLQSADFAKQWFRATPRSDLEAYSALLADTQEWLHDDRERDDTAYRYQIAELICRVTQANRRAVYDQVDEIWAEIEPASLFAVTPSLVFIKSMSRRELARAAKSVAHIARALKHVLQVSTPAGPVLEVVLPVRLMRDLLGTMLVKVLIRANRVVPGMPLAQSITALHNLAMSVQSIDITNKNGGVVVSGRIKLKCETTK